MFTFLASETLLSTATNTTYTLTFPTSGVVSMCEFKVENGLAYVGFSTVTPTSVVSITLSTGQLYRFSHSALAATKVIFSSSDASLFINYYQ